MDGKRLVGFALLFDRAALFVFHLRLDVFTCGYLVLTTALSILSAYVASHISQSKSIERVFYAKDIDRFWDHCVPALGAVEFCVFFQSDWLRTTITTSIIEEDTHPPTANP